MSDEHMHFSPAQSFMLAIGEARISGAEAERKRIIAILESIRQGDEWIGREYAIALINGGDE
jgi:hypothetical protein